MEKTKRDFPLWLKIDLVVLAIFLILVALQWIGWIELPFISNFFDWFN